MKGLHIIHVNIRSIFLKIDLLRAWVTYNKPNVITVSETWLTNAIKDNDVQINDYVLYRADRGTRAGGVATYVSSNLCSELVIPNEKPLHFECLFIKIIFHANKHLIIGNIYRPPDAPAESTQCILSTINSIDHLNEIIILGDFNRNYLDRSSAKDRNLFNSANLTQLITEPTRVDPVHLSKSLLDWILVSHPDRIIKSGVLSDCFSDHSIIFCVWKIKLPRLPPKFIKVRQFKNMNNESFICDLIAINWNRFQLIPSVEDAWNFLYTELNKVIDRHAPWMTIKIKGRHLPWINGELI